MFIIIVVALTVLYQGTVTNLNVLIKKILDSGMKIVGKLVETGVNVKIDIQDGKIGKWKQMLNDEDLKYIDSRLNEFGLKLENFEIN